MKSTLYCFAAFAALFAPFPPAAARSPIERSATQIVRVNDLDLSASNDRTILDTRIRIAARAICARLNGDGSIVLPVCIQRSVRQARAQRDALIDQHAARTPRAFL